jgi:hypothetical protein
MSTRIDSVAIVINHVDLKTGWATPLCYLTCPIGGRADNISIYGNVLSDKFYVFAAIKDTNKVVRWTVTGNSFISEVCTLQSFYPTSATNLGTAPLVTPISENNIFVDGSSIYVGLYDFTTGKLIESFAEKSSIVPSKASATGVAYFTLAGGKYIAHAHNYYKISNSPSNIQLVSVDDNMDFSTMNALWTLPQNGLGTVSIGTLHIWGDFYPISDNKGILYVFSPGNGLSAYELTDNNDASVTNITIDKNEKEEYYNLQGLKIDKPSKGIFIKKQGDKVIKVIL